jgi:ectoine hydroxylase-related dioxygenase (phytanoyl-CoA dioxygenase family)
MTLTEEQLKQYYSDGFVVVERVLSEREIVELRLRVDEAIASGIETVKRLSEADKINFDRSEVAAPPRAISRGILQDIAHRHELFWSLSRSGKILDLVEPIVGSEIAMYRSTCVFKPARNEGAVINWHQDIAYFRGSANKVTVCIALDNCTSENGCIHVIPGTHVGPIREHASRDDLLCRLVLEEKDLGSLPAPLPVEMAAGDALLFPTKLIHASKGSVNDNQRRLLEFVYQAAAGAVNHRAGPSVIVRGPGSEDWGKFPGAGRTN